ncbi:Transposon Tf2-9 polyprotein [Labeo rohita]|uniref:ribonuclease H n=1 Tax=Labeo rohita TaxID=84645 RepID=A0ABQ8LLR9_LABRO|nr:Transposon Tf2-9 polyprotein [Labeo rohita]
MELPTAATNEDPFASMVQALRETLLPLTRSPPTSNPVAKPRIYAGEPELCKRFLLQCSLYIDSNSHLFSNERAKVAFIVSLLSGRALQWAEAIWSSKSPALSSLEAFISRFREVFGQYVLWAITEVSVHEELLRLRQTSSSIHEYTLHFRSLAATSGWNETALLAAYRRGLQPRLKQQMAIYDDTAGLEMFIRKAIQISQHLSACKVDSLARTCSALLPSPADADEEPMQVDSFHLSPAERNRRIQLGLCLYCGSKDHLLSTCPVRPPRKSMSAIQLTPSVASIPHINASLISGSSAVSVKVLVDSGASGNFISSRCLERYRLPSQTCATPYQITTIQGHPLEDGRVCWRTPELELRMGCFHHEHLTLVVLQKSIVDVVLGRPWLIQHAPYINWQSGEIQRWSERCQLSCLRDVPTRPTLSVCSTSVESPNVPTVVKIPPEYSDFHNVFSKEAATQLPPHRHCNEIFRDMLHQFVVIYIDDILIYSRNPKEHFHHVKRVLQSLRKQHLLLKAEKCEFNLTTVQFLGYIITSDRVQMDQKKVQAVAEWPQPQTVKEMQRFLGFANFYRRFIKNYSLLSAALTSLLRGTKKTLTWTPAAETSFQWLKEAFTSAPILRHPNPDLPFIVEVDAANLGVGAVLSQATGKPPVIHPCAYFSKKLTTAEQNYSIGDRELLAVKLALEEWRHWLEGAKHPFLVITDHKNLQYLRSAKRLNPRQARWSLFFHRFQFKISYRPGSKNSRADGLSRLHQPDPITESPEPILPESMFLGPIQWSIDEQIQQAARTNPAPPDTPATKTYVPPELPSSTAGVSAHGARLWPPWTTPYPCFARAEILVAPYGR